jgi:hypothetical protein
LTLINTSQAHQRLNKSAGANLALFMFVFSLKNRSNLNNQKNKQQQEVTSIRPFFYQPGFNA